MNVGDLAKLKTTGENVVILRVPGDTVVVSPNGGDTGELTVRRATLSQNGVVHSLENFFPFELETPREAFVREFEEKLEFSKVQGFYTQPAKEALRN